MESLPKSTPSAGSSVLLHVALDSLSGPFSECPMMTHQATLTVLVEASGRAVLADETELLEHSGGLRVASNICGDD